MQWTRNRFTLAMAVASLMTTASALPAHATASTADHFAAIVRTTSYGVPHVLAGDLGGAGFGMGYAFAQADVCEIADRWITVNAQRSMYFGADAPVPSYDGNNITTNIQSDFFWQWILDSDVIERYLRQPPPIGPTSQVREMIRGYVAGYNLYLKETGVGKLPDRRCRGAAWLRPITEKDVYLRALHYSMFTTSLKLIPAYVRAAPPDKSLDAAAVRPVNSSAASVAETRELGGAGSNMIALGGEATANGRGMLFANPHWYWNGPERFLESQITVPGEMNVYGISTLGFPFILIGFTDHVAWSHTVSTPIRQTIYQLHLTPHDPTSYVYEGKPLRLGPRTVNVRVRAPAGQWATRSHTFWGTQRGLVLEDGTFPWTRRTAYWVRDVAMDLRWLNAQIPKNEAQSVQDIDAIGREYLDIPWLNTTAADSSGRTLYVDNTAIPYVNDAMLDKCVTSKLGMGLLDRRTIVLDGWRSACEWGSAPDSIQPGTFGVSSRPRLMRDDYVANSNDSYWTTNAHDLLEGYPRMMGDERTPRSLRTRLGLLKIERRLSGKDGYPGNRFTLENLESITMDNRVLSAELWRDAVVTLCERKFKVIAGDACNVLSRWDLTENLGSRGAVLWRRFFERLIEGTDSAPERIPAELYAIPFDSRDPVNTPRELNIDVPRVGRALVAAVGDLRDSGISLDASLRAYQYSDRNGTRIPFPGGRPDAGQYNVVWNFKGWVPHRGWPDVSAGSSYVMWVQFTETGPKGRSILTYSQSNNPDSPHHSDQTQLFSQGKSKPILFAESEISADSNLTVKKICVEQGKAFCE
jgi:acyl-homoserine-lactone acylase